MLSFRSCNGGSGLIGKSGRKTANVCDKHAKETTRNTVTDFTAVAFIILLRRSQHKVPEHVPKNGQWAMGVDSTGRQFPQRKSQGKPEFPVIETDEPPRLQNRHLDSATGNAYPG